jgi:DNA-binding NtrC family response regulator
VKRILVVDDDALMLALIQRALPEFDVTIVQDAEAALCLATPGTPIDLVIADYLMPQMTGDELLGQLRERRPNLKALIITGHGDILAHEVPDWWARESHLAKPFQIQDLRAAVVRLLGPAV